MAEALAAEVAALDPRERLVMPSGFRVYCTSATRIPLVLEEIGRLRELTFRAAGEGTGKTCDIDAFDAHYLHLFLWDVYGRKGSRRLSPRLGRRDSGCARKARVYTHSLFSYPTRFLKALGPAIELGRSFVRPEYQRDAAPLFLLWRAIARFVERSPAYAVLFGAVSISASYSHASRRLMVEYLSAHCSEKALASHVRPRLPYGGCAAGDHVAPQNLEELARLVAQIEEDRKGVPVLLRQYLRLGGRLLGFSVDKAFADTLDGLIMVDLRQIDPAVLARYMGKDASVAFRAHHALDGLRPTHPGWACSAPRSPRSGNTPRSVGIQSAESIINIGQ